MNESSSAPIEIIDLTGDDFDDVHEQTPPACPTNHQANKTIVIIDLTGDDDDENEDKPATCAVKQKGSDCAAVNEAQNDEQDHADPILPRYNDDSEAEIAGAVAQQQSPVTSDALEYSQSASRFSPVPDPLDLEPSLWANETREFQGIVIINNNVMATRVARRAEMEPMVVDGQEEVVISTDGSIEGSLDLAHRGVARGYAMVIKASPLAPSAQNKSARSSAAHFDIHTYKTLKAFSTQHMEIAGVARAMLYAAQESKARFLRGAESRRFRIFTDSQNVLDRIKLGIPGRSSFFDLHTRPFVKAIVYLSHALHENGDRLELHWIPRCITIGHSLADKGAKNWMKASDEDLPSSTHGDPQSVSDRLHAQVRTEIQKAVTHNVYSRRRKRAQRKQLLLLRDQDRNRTLTTEMATELAMLEKTIGSEVPTNAQ